MCTGSAIHLPSDDPFCILNRNSPLPSFDKNDKTHDPYHEGDNQRQKENQGQIMIYDGLHDTTVKQALDNNFERIENMMFTRVVITNEDGQPKTDEAGNQVVEDDGC